MTNATKTLTGIFAALLLITAIVKWGDNRSSSEAFRSKLVRVDTASVNMIVIEKPGNNALELREEQGIWQVTDSRSENWYEADQNTVGRALDRLNNLNVKAVATRNPDKHTRYKVDSTGTGVSLYNENENLLAGIILGAPNIVSQREYNSYVRPVDENAVYTVEGFLNATFNRDLEAWRNKQVWELDRNRISRVDFLFPGDSSYSVQQVGEYKWISEEDTLKSGPVSTMLDRLSTLQASGFVDSDSLTTENFGSDLYAIHIQLDNGGQKKLRIKPSENKAEFAVVATDYPYVFTVNKAAWNDVVLNPRRELLKKDEVD